FEGRKCRLIGGVDLDLAGNFKICTRRAVKITRLRGDLDRRAEPRRRRLCSQGKGEAFRDIVFDEEARLPNRISFLVREGLDAPGARCNARKQGKRKAAAAVPLIPCLDPLIFNAIGTFDDKSQRYGGHTHSMPIAEEGGDENRLARTVDAALRIDESIERGLCRAALDTPVGQIESRRLEVEETVIALAVLGDDQARRHAARAARKTRIEMNVTGLVGALRSQYFIVAREQAHFDRGKRLCARERAQEHMNAVLAGKSGEAEIGDDEP